MLRVLQRQQPLLLGAAQEVREGLVRAVFDVDGRWGVRWEGRGQARGARGEEVCCVEGAGGEGK